MWTKQNSSFSQIWPKWYQFSTCFIKRVTSVVGSAAAAAKLLQSCPTLCDPIEDRPPGPTIPGILQARTPEWVAISFSNAWKWKVKVKSLSRLRLLATPWIVGSRLVLIIYCFLLSPNLMCNYHTSRIRPWKLFLPKATKWSARLLRKNKKLN